MEEGKRYHVGDPGWNTIYSARINRFLTIAAEHGTSIFWVGLPIMGQDKYGDKIRIINQLVASACAGQKMAKYFDTWSVLAADNGAYSSFLKMRKDKKYASGKDEIHLTEAGGEIMTNYFLSAIKPYVNWSAL
ncbi:MAG: hypothetical protein HZT40_21360 [Candidatus Thiothrix singaporensis]|uniref:SGNH hydrolase-type esterase domain-containing protein n=1 Tax=Candidatus Thiothrix singaporensis TaxID=2799669 RepID=A0A7L6AX30_9GAMM|nr:MAG: hypothetical protein HZT40_21360 [Candidatus Thiothrix singaporensis]